jgi:uncharacterized C2H2 Zn-finger protein
MHFGDVQTTGTVSDREEQPNGPARPSASAPPAVSAVKSAPGTLKCPTCGETIQKVDGEFLVVRNAILRVDLRHGSATAKCPRCKSWVEVMLRYGA